ncbi:Serine/threonine protein kinase [Handroanthus impetiginosus]|uniref:Serine/threonine protein kinase n=1 Tax=Handroanthus impetiginosus TaxID=429701 RepID=A0A2G9H638_9LAMI|nr:Serine/threonine protein kinase [Handroanthus impetiginosus]
MGYQSYVNFDPNLPFPKWPAPGLELMWTAPPEPLCKTPLDCRELPFSKCLTNPANSPQKRCLCKKGRYWDPATGYCQKCRHGTGCKYHKNQTPVIGSSVGVLVLLALTGFLVYRQRQYVKKSARKTLIKEREEILNANSGGKSAKIFTGKELKKATIDFSRENLLGSGGFGEVFKGILDDGIAIAVKRAKPGNAKGTAQVLNEVRILCQVNHRNLVRLLGCCVDLDQPLLVYEYVPNGTLFDHLHKSEIRNRTPLRWLRRLLIAHQTAGGLAYLHSSAVPPIYHRDVKTSNILLDENLDAKVSDFGLSRLVGLSERDCTYIHTSAQGTLGYLDPEYYLNLQLTDRSDVYSFGVVLLELLTSKKAIDFNREEENVNLVVYMKRIFDEERLMNVIDPVIKDGASEVELETMKAIGDLAAACLDERRQNRPSMKEVADEIECVISILTGDASKG